jgi:hypothetical protein
MEPKNKGGRLIVRNTLFPGRPKYVGPKKGWFGLLHHEQLYEESHNVMERVDYTRANKPPNEVKVRLHNMIYLGGCAAVKKRKALTAGYYAKRQSLAADYNAKRKLLTAGYNAKRKLLTAGYYAKLKLLDADYNAKCKPLDADYDAKLKLLDADYDAKLKLLDADYNAKCKPLDDEILAYILKHIPDCPWDGKTIFPEKRK